MSFIDTFVWAAVAGIVFFIGVIAGVVGYIFRVPFFAAFLFEGVVIPGFIYEQLKSLSIPLFSPLLTIIELSFSLLGRFETAFFLGAIGAHIDLYRNLSSAEEGALKLVGKSILIVGLVNSIISFIFVVANKSCSLGFSTEFCWLNNALLPISFVPALLYGFVLFVAIFNAPFFSMKVLEEGGFPQLGFSTIGTLLSILAIMFATISVGSIALAQYGVAFG